MFTMSPHTQVAGPGFSRRPCRTARVQPDRRVTPLLVGARCDCVTRWGDGGEDAAGCGWRLVRSVTPPVWLVALSAAGNRMSWLTTLRETSKPTVPATTWEVGLA